MRPVSEPSPILYEAVGRILCTRAYCGLCHDLLTDCLASLKHGPEATLKAVLAHEGMLCKCAIEMREIAQKAIDRVTPRLMSKRESKLLIGADPDCIHVHDERSWSGIRCAKCGGHYCL